MAVSRHVLSFEVPCDPHAPAIVRDALAGVHDGGWPLDDGLLVASELVTNAVRHSGGTEADPLQVDVQIDGASLRISVHDPGFSRLAAHPVDSDSTEPRGWGLRIIDALSVRWGTERPDGYRVWAELPVSA